MFQSNRSPILCCKEGTAGLPVPLFLEQFEQEQRFYLPLGTVLNLLITSEFRCSNNNTSAKVFDLDCIWNIRLRAHANCICFKISVPCIPSSFKWMLFFQFIGIRTTFYLKHKNSKPCKKPCSSFKLCYSDFVEKSVMKSIQACYKCAKDWVCGG